MQNSRLFEMVYLLLGRGHMTAKELAERFGVSVRTIYRDVDVLSNAGVPVYTTQGSGGGIRLSDSYVLNKSTLTDMEQAEILLALKSLSVADDTHASELLARLGSLFGKTTDEWIEVDFSQWGQQQKERDVLAQLKKAILFGHVVTFLYYGANGSQTHRNVYPVKLLFKANAWYVNAFDPDKDAYRTFKLYRMFDLCITECFFQKDCLPPLPDIDAFWEYNAPQITASLWFASHAIWRIWDAMHVLSMNVDTDGSCIAVISLIDDEWLIGTLLSFGAAMKVLEPISLQQRLLKEMQKISAVYSQT